MARELAEAVERTKWVGVLRDIVVAANLPLTPMMATMQPWWMVGLQSLFA